MAVRFLVEAHQLKITGGESQRLTTVQALLIMNLTYSCFGKDKIGSQCLESAVQVAVDMGLYHQSPTSTSGDQDLNQARAVTAWGLFEWQAYGPPVTFLHHINR